MSTRPVRFTRFAEQLLSMRLTAGQRALARVMFDGDDPGALEDHDERALALEMFGGAESIPSAAYATRVIRAGRSSGKSTLSAAYGLYRAVTADVSACGPGDEPAVVVVSTKLGDKTHGGGGSVKEILRYALFFAQQHPRLCDAVRNPTSTGFAIEMPGRPRVRFIGAPRSSGTAVRSISMACLIVDESEFLSPGSGTTDVTDGAVIGAARPRMLPGAPIVLISTPWPAQSATKTIFEGNFGNPLSALCAKATTLQLRDDDPELSKQREAHLAIDPAGALREWDCEDTDASGCFFEASAVDACAVDPNELSPENNGTASVGVDLAFVSDASACVVLERQGGLAKVVLLDTELPRPGKPLRPTAICKRYAAHAVSVGAGCLVADAHELATLREISEEVGLEITCPSSNRFEMFSRLRRLLRERRILIPRGPLVGQLKSVQQKRQPGGGVQVVIPRIAGQGHADAVLALVNAVWMDRRFGDPAAQVADYEPVRSSVFDGMIAGRPEPPQRSTMRNEFVVPSALTPRW